MKLLLLTSLIAVAVTLASTAVVRAQSPSVSPSPSVTPSPSVSPSPSPSPSASPSVLGAPRTGFGTLTE